MKTINLPSLDRYAQDLPTFCKILMKGVVNFTFILAFTLMLKLQDQLGNGKFIVSPEFII